MITETTRATVKDTAPETTRRENPYARQYASFLEQTKGHQLTVLQEQGMHRQLHMRNPAQGSSWSWTFTTWPGHLATSGDIGAGFVFARDADMLNFFTVPQHKLDKYSYSDGAPSIDFRYWAEKLQGTGNYDRVRRYSHDVFLQDVADALEEHSELGVEAQEEYDHIVAATKAVCAAHNITYEDHLEARRKLANIEKFRGRNNMLTNIRTETLAPLKKLVELDIDPEDPLQLEYFGQDIPAQSPAERRYAILASAKDLNHDENEVREWLQEQESDGVFYDIWEWDLRDFDSHFIYLCYALELTTRRWNEFCTTRTHTVPSHIPVKLQAFIAETLDCEYASYVLDGQTTSTEKKVPGTDEHDGWHDVVAVVDNGDETSQFHKFTMDPDGLLTHRAMHAG